MSIQLRAYGYHLQSDTETDAAIRQRIASAAEAAGYRLVMTLPDNTSGKGLLYLLTAFAFDTSIAAIVVPSIDDLAHLDRPREMLTTSVSVVFADTGNQWERRQSDPGEDPKLRAAVLTAWGKQMLEDNNIEAIAEAAE
jgi:hypothetical protein